MYLDYEMAKMFALNSISIGNNMIVPVGADTFIKKLKEKGFVVYEVDMSEFLKFGGGLKCLTF